MTDGKGEVVGVRMREREMFLNSEGEKVVKQTEEKQKTFTMNVLGSSALWLLGKLF